MKHKHFVLITAMTAMSLAFSLPALAQHGHGGGPPAGHGPGMANSSGSGPNSNAMSHTDMSHASPSTVLSHNTAIAGNALKAKVTGTGAISLGKAIQSFAPSANAKSEVKKANQQASDDMKDAEPNS